MRIVKQTDKTPIYLPTKSQHTQILKQADRKLTYTHTDIKKIDTQTDIHLHSDSETDRNQTDDVCNKINIAAFNDGSGSNYLCKMGKKECTLYRLFIFSNLMATINTYSLISNRASEVVKNHCIKIQDILSLVLRYNFIKTLEIFIFKLPMGFNCLTNSLCKRYQETKV